MVDALDSKSNTYNQCGGSSPLASNRLKQFVKRAYNSLVECAAHDGNVEGSIPSWLKIYA